MNLSEALATGRHGLTFSLPDGLETLADEQAMVVAVDRERGVEWRAFYAADLHLDLTPERRAHLVAEMRLHARQMFDDVGRTLDEARPEGGGPFPDAGPPADFDPMVEVVDVTVDGAPGLTFVHRMALRPGTEMVMGHLLIPLAGGLFEVRVLARDQQTGFRESVLMLKIDGALDLDADAEPRIPPRSVFDDPAHDAAFPEHSLSRIRAALRRAMDESGTKVSRPARPRAPAEFVSARQGLALTAPPRFVPAGDLLVRVSFCATDGLAELRIATAEPMKGDLEAIARRDAIELWSTLGPMTLTHCRLEPDGRVHVVLEGQGPAAGLRLTGLWFRGPGGRLCTLTLIGGVGVPFEHSLAELGPTADSVRWLDPPAPEPPARKRWWWPFG